MKLFDYHTHTTRCKHATGTMEEYVLSGIRSGLGDMGFSDHLPMPKPGLSPWNMSASELPGYVAEVSHLKARYPDMSLRLGIEADFFPEYVPELKALLSSAPFDYVIGSVHYLSLGPGLALHADQARTWGVDSAEDQEEWKSQQADKVYAEYFRQMRLCAESGLFQIMGHLDLPKKFGHRSKSDLSKEIRETAEAFARHGVVVELNTAGLRKPVGEIYPSLPILKVLRECQVPVTLGSDAHAAADVAAGFSQALALAREAGYDSIHRWAAPGVFEPVPLAGLEA